MSFKLALPYLSAFLLTLTACQDDAQNSSNFENDKLIGRWEIVEAARNGKKTETLTGTFYEFDDAGKMVTNLNLTALPEQYDYKFNGREITQKGGSETVFKIDSLTDSLLRFSMIINKYPFHLTLAKVDAEQESETIIEEGILQ